MQYFNDELTADFYKNMCYYWLEKNINDNSTTHIDTKNTAYRNIELGSVTFDFACRKDRNVYAYFDTLPGKGLSASL